MYVHIYIWIFYDVSLEFKVQVEGLGCYSEVSLPEPVQVGHVSISAFCDAPARGV